MKDYTKEPLFTEIIESDEWSSSMSIEELLRWFDTRGYEIVRKDKE